MAEKILIVDDDLDSLKLIGLMLQRHGYEVVAANAGNQALSKANSDHPNLIILDVMMPDMDGYEVCRRLRANPETRSIPIIMFTAKTLVDDKVAGFEAGADDYLTKPTHPAELASRVKSVLSRTTVQRQPEPERGTTIGVIGAKGGVGTSTIALNMSAAFNLKGDNSILADFRLGCGSLGLLLGFNQPSGMANILSKPSEEIRPSSVEGELVTHQSGLRTLLSSVRTKEFQINYSPETASTVVRGLRTLGTPVILDLGAGLNNVTLRLSKEMDHIILVVEPNPVALTMAKELLSEIEANGRNKERINLVVVNRVQSSVQTPWHEIEHTLGHELRAIIPASHDQVFQAMRAAVPVVISQPGTPISSQIIKLVDDLSVRIKTQAVGEVSQ